MIAFGKHATRNEVSLGVILKISHGYTVINLRYDAMLERHRSPYLAGATLNFLAHALLAGDDPALIVGGVIGDWIKGPLPGILPDDLAKGVALHRAIDSFAELQPAFRRSRSRISGNRRRYAGVLVDVFYDHLLARKWNTLHHRPLDEYCDAVYQLIKARLNEMPNSSRPALTLMAQEDWLSSYAQIEGIADVLARMSRRARQPNPLMNGEHEFLADVDGFTCDFYEWLDDTKTFCRQWHRVVRQDQSNADCRPVPVTTRIGS